MKYPLIMRAFHWLVAGLVFAVWPLGMVIKFVRDDVKLDFYLVHESLGFLVLWVMLVRTGIRLTRSVPPSLATGLQRRIATVVHVMLYLCLIVMPISGFLATNAHGFPLQWFGLLPIWSPIGKSPQIAPIFSFVHTWTAWILLGLVALHLAGVAFHHLIRRDATLLRMI